MIRRFASAVWRSVLFVVVVLATYFVLRAIVFGPTTTAETNFPYDRTEILIAIEKLACACVATMLTLAYYRYMGSHE